MALFNVDKISNSLEDQFKPEQISLYKLEEYIRALYESNQHDKLIKDLNNYLEKYSGSYEKIVSNKMLNTIELLQNKTVLKSKPMKLRIALTSDCNIRCLMCSSHNYHFNISENIFKEIIGLLPYLRYVQWYGGEVFVSKYFKDIFDEACKYPYLVQRIDTNGLLLNETWINKIVEHSVGLDISIDGITKDIYEKIRYGGKFENLIDNLNLIYKKGKETASWSRPENKTLLSMSFITMKSNYRQLEGIVEFAKKYNFGALIINYLCATDYTQEFYKQEKLDDSAEIMEHINKVMPHVINEADKCGIKVHDRVSRNNSHSMVTKQSNTPRKDKLFCFIPWQQLETNFLGGVRPYCFCKKNAGDINKNSLEEIWNNEIFQEYRAKLLSGNCSDFCSAPCLNGQVVNLRNI
ncbi:MAG: radical SAM protein [Endomicrobiales bacterium]|nr:radical SAM protein [Endomicrobiales bacterium]